MGDGELSMRFGVGRPSYDHPKDDQEDVRHCIDTVALGKSPMEAGRPYHGQRIFLRRLNQLNVIQQSTELLRRATASVRPGAVR